MASVYHRYATKNGKRVRQRDYIVSFNDLHGRVRRVRAFPDKRNSSALADTIDGLLVCRSSSSRPDSDLLKRVERLPFRIIDKLREFGILDPAHSGNVKPLTAHLDDWESSIRAAGRTANHVKRSLTDVRLVCDSLGWVFWSDADAGEVDGLLEKWRTEGYTVGKSKRRAIGATRSNAIQRSVKQFGRWMVRERRAAENPLDRLRPLNATTDRRHVRRALTIDEFRRLLTAAAQGPERYGLPGPVRSLLFRLAVETGLRASELRSLRAGSFDLDGLTVAIEAKTAKNRRADELSIRRETADLLRKHLARKAPAAMAFDLPRVDKFAKMIRADLSDAGVAITDEMGRVLDFHSLRLTCATMLAEAGVPLTTAQAIMRHSDPKLTASVYTTRFRETEARAVERLPNFDDSVSNSVSPLGARMH